MSFSIADLENLSDMKLYVCNLNKNILGDGAIPLTSDGVDIEIKKNDIYEISFTTYRYTDGVLNKTYDYIEPLRLIYIKEIGYFTIKSCPVDSTSENNESKTVSAKSIEVMLGQKYLNSFVINMGTDESIDGVQFYSLNDPSKSLLHLALEKFPDWTINHVDPELMELQRCFEIDNQDVYSFLMENVAGSFDCEFTFDITHNYINAYKEGTLGDDTNIHVSYHNLLKNVSMTTNADDIKTCLTITGDDDLTVREVNMGNDKIYNLDYYHSTDWMSQGLYDAYSNWKQLWNDNVEGYTDLVTTYQGYYSIINTLKYTMSPDDVESTDWTEYSLSGLEEKLAIYQNQESVYAQMGYGDGDTTSGSNYLTYYKPNHDIILAITSEVNVRKSQISEQESLASVISNNMSVISNLVSMTNPDNFTDEQLKELSRFIMEDTLSSNNFVVTDEMTEEEKIDAITELLEFGQSELAKISQPVYEFTSEMLNLFTIDGFEKDKSKFAIGNYIHMSLRDDYHIKLLILGIRFNPIKKSDFTVTFGNITKSKVTGLIESVSSALSLASSAATSVSFGQSYWNRGSQEATTIGKMLSDGLLVAGQQLASTNTDISTVRFTERGIFIDNDKDNAYPDDGIYLGNGRILFTDDNWITVATGVGRFQYFRNGQVYNEFGLIAKAVISGYIATSVLEGNEIIAGIIRSENYNKEVEIINPNIDIENTNLFYNPYPNSEGSFFFNGNTEEKLRFLYPYGASKIPQIVLNNYQYIMVSVNLKSSVLDENYSVSLGLEYKDKNGDKQYVYGVGNTDLSNLEDYYRCISYIEITEDMKEMQEITDVFSVCHSENSNIYDGTINYQKIMISINDEQTAIPFVNSYVPNTGSYSDFVETTTLGAKIDLAMESGTRFIDTAKFKVENDGTVKATDGEFSGKISATLGDIAGWTIAEYALYRGGGWNTSGGMYFGDNGLSISNTFRVNTAGALYATGATIYGTGYINAGQIGGFDIASNRIGEATLGYGLNGMYLLTDGSFAFSKTRGGSWARFNGELQNGTIQLYTAGSTQGGGGVDVSGGAPGDSGGWIRWGWSDGSRSDGYYVSWYSGSDRRLKKDIKSIEFEKVRKFFELINPVEFRYNELTDTDHDKLHFGGIAQEFEEILQKTGFDYTNILEEKNVITPQSTMENYETKKYKFINYHETFGFIYGGIKDLYEQINELKGEITCLKQQIV